MDKWRRTGILWWNIMDGWPQLSDAVVDYYFEKKLAYHFIKRVQQDVCVSISEPYGWDQSVYILNDTRSPVKLSVKITDVESGAVIFETVSDAGADSSVIIGRIPYPRNRQRLLLLEWSGSVSGRNHYLSGEPPFNLDEYRTWLCKAKLL
jgi:beta-mannosidase